MQAPPDNANRDPGQDSSEMPPAGRMTRRARSGPSQFSRWSSIRPGRSLVWFPILVATAWAAVIAVFVAVSVLSDAEEGASWGEGLGAIAGNFVVAWVVAIVVSALIRFSKRS